MELTIIIPILNNEEVLEDTIKNIRGAVKNPEILLIWDVTKDEFKAKAIKEAGKMKKYGARTIFRFNQRGFGSAIRLGFKEAKGKYVVVMMGDLCDQPQTLPVMMKKMKEGYDIVAGSRYSEGGGIVGDTLKQRISSGVSLLINIFSKVKCRDVTNSFKMYKKEVLDSLSNELVSNSFELSPELTLKAARKGYKITQVPTIWKNRNVGQSNFKMFGEAKRYFKMFMYAVFHMPSLLTKFLFLLLIALVAYGAVSFFHLM